MRKVCFVYNIILKNLTVFCCFLCISCNSHAINNTIATVDTINSIKAIDKDTAGLQTTIQLLKNYTYYVIVEDKNKQPIISGSGFFLRLKGRLFFITCQHVAYKKNADHLFVVNEVTQDTYLFPLSKNPNKIFNDEKPPRVDLTILPVDSSNANVYELSAFIDKNYFDKAPDIFITWGYPGNQFEGRNVRFNKQLLVHDKINTDSIILSKAKVSSEIVNKSRYIDSVINHWNETDIQLPFVTSKGYSGSPVFGYFKNTHRMQLIGMVWGASPTLQLSFGHRIKTILDTLRYKP